MYFIFNKSTKGEKCFNVNKQYRAFHTQFVHGIQPTIQHMNIIRTSLYMCRCNTDSGVFAASFTAFSEILKLDHAVSWFV